MSYEKVRQARKNHLLVTGTKQSKKAIEKLAAELVVVADDADPEITETIQALCKNSGIQVVHVDSMKELGKACGIQVGAAVATILKEK